MMKRRQFLGCLTAFGGSAILAACGGGGSEADDASGAASNDTAAAKVTANAATPAASGTLMPPASSITDNSGSVWTLKNGYLYRNGTLAGNNHDVTAALFYGGQLYCVNSSGQWYVGAAVPSGWLACTDPRLAPSSYTPGGFFGINGHHDYTYTPAQLLSILKGLGCTSYRVGCSSDPAQIAAVAKIAQTLVPAGIKVLVLINQGLYDTSGQIFASETAAYNTARSAGASIAKALAPCGVTMYECGNELTRDRAIILNLNYAGTKMIDFNNTNWPILRGVLRGMIAGVKSVQASAKCGVNFCVNDIGAADALWEGMQPDQSKGHPTVRWDITTWHNYEVYGDILKLGTDAANGTGIDLPTYCKARYGVPFMITEWNTGPEKSETYRGSFITTKLTSLYNARKTHNIQSAMYYVLDSGNQTFGIMINGTPINPSYNAFKAFTAAHADN